jgi:putative sterol carrier protein
MAPDYRIRSKRLVAAVFAVGLMGAVGNAFGADPVLMSADWAKAACDAWNADPVLTDELAASGWAKNDKGRGYKVMHVYRTDCAASPRVEMRIALQENKAKCVYGGPVENAKPDLDVDYVMHAETKRWDEMGKGEYGPMRAMMFGRLKFDGPNWEAMKNMGPFEQFLLIGGKVASDKSSCPQ